jgi:hypothetical protein
MKAVQKRYTVHDIGGKLITEVYAPNPMAAARRFTEDRHIGSAKFTQVLEGANRHVRINWTDLRGVYENPPRMEFTVTLRRAK